MAKRRRGRDVTGLIILDKPQGETSNKSLQKVKALFKAAKAGHTGSLDPLATGVLPLCFGEATKISQFLLDSDKRYRTRIKLGVRTATGDSEGEVINAADASHIKLDDVEKALANFRGEIEQIPSMYSALKHEGVPLYKLAREGKDVERKARRVRIYENHLLSFEGDVVELEILCSKGTYIRTIADDLGESLACGAHVISLRRLQAGVFKETESKTFEELEGIMAAGGFEALDRELIPCDRAVSDFPRVDLPEISASYIQQGQAVFVPGLPLEGLVRLYQGENFLGIGIILEDGRVGPKRLIRA